MYSYYSIRGDPLHSATAPVAQIRAALDARPELRPGGPRTYTNAPDHPWVVVAIVNCDAAGNYPAGLPQSGPDANLVEVTGSQGSGEGYYRTLARELGAALGWEVVDEDGEIVERG
jgi:hypothetical protein